MKTITPEQLKVRLAAGEKPQIIDVREDEEVAQGMIPGAKHIALSQFADRFSEIDNSSEVIMVCRSGNRSGKAAEYLEMMGYPEVVNMSGGMLAWDREE